MKNLKLSELKIPRFLINRLPIILFVFFYVLFCLATFKDYGATWDEADVYFRGESLYLYFQDNLDTSRIDLVNKVSDEGGQLGNVIYNHIYGAVVHGVAKNIFGSTSIQIYHLINLLFAIIIYVAAYEVLLKFYKSKYLALLGPSLIFLTPRFLGDTPANPKDMPFAVIFFLGLALIYLISNIKDVFTRAIILGIIFGFAFNLRVLGITLLIVYGLFVLYKYIDARNKLNAKKYFIKESKIIILAAIIAYMVISLTWPYIAVSPFFHLVEIFQSSKDFAWKGSLLFNGQYLSTPELPFWYIPYLILITTPVFIIILVACLPITVKKIAKNEPLFLFGGALLINLLMYVILRPIVYDGLRHYLFAVPLVSFLASISLIEVIRNFKNRKILIPIALLISINIFLIIVQILKLYPIHYIYYNELVGNLSGASSSFERDYWGASFKEAIDWLKVNEFTETERVYKVNTCANPSIAIPELQPYQSRKYAEWTAYDNAEYFVCYEREIDNFQDINGKLIHVVVKDGVNINYVYKLYNY